MLCLNESLMHSLDDRHLMASLRAEGEGMPSERVLMARLEAALDELDGYRAAMSRVNTLANEIFNITEEDS